MDPGRITTVAALGASVLLLVYLYRRSKGMGTLFYVAAFFVFFAFGPIINYLLGNTIYFGIPVEYIDDAAIGFAVALAGLTAADVVRRSEVPEAYASDDTGAAYPLLPIILLPLIGYGAVMCAHLVPLQLAGATKVGTLAAAGSFHYVYLLIQLAAVATYFMARRVQFVRNLWTLNTVVYVVYCLATAERDFLFVLFSILLYRQIQLGRKRLSMRFVAAGVGAVLTASVLFAHRAGERLDLAGVLNQGSLLFVDSYVLRWFDQQGDYRWGQTYVESAVSSTPLYDSGGEPLSEWLANQYAPGGDSAYGFSLTAEAFLNFGYIGIFVVFLLLGLFQQALIRRFGTSDWWTYLAVYGTTVILYALRGDSAQLLSALVFGAVFFLAVRVLQIPSTRDVTSAAVLRGTAPPHAGR